MKKSWQEIEKLAKAVAVVEDGASMAPLSWMDFIVKAQVITALMERIDPLKPEGDYR